MNNLNLNVEDVGYLLRGEDIYDDEGENLLFQVIERKYIDHDIDKNYVDFSIKILDVKNNIKYQSQLRDSNYYCQREENAEQTWSIID